METTSRGAGVVVKVTGVTVAGGVMDGGAGMGGRGRGEGTDGNLPVVTCGGEKLIIDY